MNLIVVMEYEIPMRHLEVTCLRGDKKYIKSNLQREIPTVFSHNQLPPSEIIKDLS